MSGGRGDRSMTVVDPGPQPPRIVSWPEDGEGDHGGFMGRWLEWRQRFDRHHWPDSWQGCAFRNGHLRFPSPWSDSDLCTRWSLRRGFHFAYVLQEGSRRALLIPGYLGAGHEIEAVYLIEEQVLVHLPCSLAGPEWFLQILELLLQDVVHLRDADPLWPERPVVLRLEGHPNFAHCLLNTYTCLESVDPADVGLIEVVGMQPFGPLEDIFPHFSWRVPPPGQAPDVSVFDLPMSQRPTGISMGLRRRLLDYAAGRLGPRGRDIRDRLVHLREAGYWFLWISLKRRGAHAINLEKLIVAWMTSLNRAGTPPVLMLDGFSLQYGQNPHDILYGTSIEEMVREENQQAEHIDAMLQEAGLRIPTVNCVGLNLSESVHLAGWSDFYLCHQGTVQHKIGWLQSEVDGVVHSSSVRNRGGLHPWGGLGGRAPTWLPQEWIEDRGSDPAQPRQPYAFIDDSLGDCVDFLNSQLRRSLPGRPARRHRSSPALPHGRAGVRPPPGPAGSAG